MNKIKQILPSLREKKRYIAFKIRSKENFSKKQIENAINMVVLNYIGQLGYARAGVMFIDFDKNKGIIKVNNKEANNIKASFLFVNEIENKKAFISSITASGILNKARSAIKEE